VATETLTSISWILACCGLGERFHHHLEQSFLPGRVFTSPTDCNTVLPQWLIKANSRHHRRLGCRPIDRVDADKSAMLALPPGARSRARWARPSPYSTGSAPIARTETPTRSAN
jgi:hypothetical protein